MSTSEYYLYRIKIIKPTQTRMFVDQLSPSDIFKKALDEKPSITLKQSKVWHIGNIKYFDNNKNTGVFAIGRTSKTTVEKYDSSTGNFLDELNDSSPYTLVVFDRDLGILGIGKKTKVASTTNIIAKRMKKIFEESETIKEYGVDIKIDAIYDPIEFIDKITSAYSIKQFKISFTGPNPIDADEYFNKPLSNMSQKSNAERGILELQSEKSLDNETIESLARSTASLGNNATAKIQISSGAKSIPIRLKGDIANIPDKANFSPKEILKSIISLYNRIRYNERS